MSTVVVREKNWIKFYETLLKKRGELDLSNPVWASSPSELSEIDKKHLMDELKKKEEEEQLKFKCDAALSELKVSSEKLNIVEYNKLLPLIKLSGILQKNDKLEEHAIKLILAFGTKDKAVQYLRKFENENFLSKQLMQDACSFILPRGEWNTSIWRKLAVKHMPNKEFSKFFERGVEIEGYIKKEREKLEDEIESKVRQEWEFALGEEYEKEKAAFSVPLNQYIDVEFKKEKTRIDKAVNKNFDFYCRTHLQIPEKGKLSRELIEKLKKYKESSEGIKKLGEIRANIESKIKKEIEQRYQSRKGMPTSAEKQEHIKAGLLRDSKKIEERIGLAKQAVFSENTSIEKLKQYYAASRYKKAGENLWAAEVFSEYDMREDAFDFYLTLAKKDSESIPPLLKPSEIPILIEGSEIGHPGFYLTKLSPTDPRCAVLGKLTSCCQHADVSDGPARAMISHGIEQESGGFYVLCQHKRNGPPSLEDPIISQCWAWRSLSGALCFDSIETQVNSREKHNHLIVDFFMSWGRKLVSQYGVSQVLVGTGSGTPKNLGVLETDKPERPTRFFDYDRAQLLDSQKQRFIANDPLRHIQGFLKIQKELTSRSLESDKSISREKKEKTEILQAQSQSQTVLQWCALCRYMNSEDFHSYLSKKNDQIADSGSDLLEELFLQSKKVLELLEDPKRFKELVEILKKNPVFHFFKNKNGTTALMDACKSGNVVMVSELLAVGAGASCNSIDHQGKTALIHACEDGNIEVISALLTAGVDYNSVDQLGKTALMYACGGGNVAAVSALLTAGADYNVADKGGKTTFMYACESGNAKLILELLARGKLGINAALNFACKKGDLGLITALLDSGADVDCPLEMELSEDMTPLGFASQQGHVKMAELLLKRKADVNKQDERGFTALMYAVASRKFEIVSLLLRAGADPNIKGEAGRFKRKTIFEYLQSKDDPEMIKFLQSELAKVEVEKKRLVEVPSPTVIFSQESTIRLPLAEILKEAAEFIDPTKRQGSKYEQFKASLGFGDSDEIREISASEITVSNAEGQSTFNIKERYEQNLKSSVKKMDI